jgi:hypothetical protein
MFQQGLVILRLLSKRPVFAVTVVMVDEELGLGWVRLAQEEIQGRSGSNMKSLTGLYSAYQTTEQIEDRSVEGTKVDRVYAIAKDIISTTNEKLAPEACNGYSAASLCRSAEAGVNDMSKRSSNLFASLRRSAT